VLDNLVRNWDKYENFILELPTGVGKSAIAITLARWLNATKPSSMNSFSREKYQPFHTYITTTSIELENQYESSYSRIGLKKLYSADHYSCCRKEGFTCGQGKRLEQATGKSCGGNCPYSIAKADFIYSPVGIVNLAYYLNETYYAGQLVPRGVHIFDECHTVGDTVQDFVSLEITKESLVKFLLSPPISDGQGGYNIEDLVKWMKDVYLKRVEMYLNRYVSGIKNWVGSEDDPKYEKMVEEMTSLDKYACRLHRILDKINKEEWVAEQENDNIKLTPIVPRSFMNEVLFRRCYKKVFLSATVLDFDYLIKEYDLDPNTTYCFKADSPFPKQNRPIYYFPSGKLDHNNLSLSMRPFSENVKLILEEHSNERGIIFTSSYAQSEELMLQVNSSRIITHSSSRDKPEMMRKHSIRNDSIIISPSMHEGVDLKGELSRFQIILKLPFPNLGSHVVQSRVDKYPEWYSYVTSLLLIQSTGRSIRSETDYATTYILDSNFGWFVSKWRKFFPQYWLDSLKTIN
jgi:Rad3-related DNA helicase